MKNHTKLLSIIISILIIAMPIMSGCDTDNKKTEETIVCTDSTETTAPAPPAEASKISLGEAYYNAEEKKIETKLHNDSGTAAITYTGMFSLYKSKGDEEINITPSYGAYGTASVLLPDEESPGDLSNFVELEFPIYNTAGENISYSEEFEKASLEEGNYILEMEVELYENPEYITFEGDDSTEVKALDQSGEHSTMILRTYFDTFKK